MAAPSAFLLSDSDASQDLSYPVFDYICEDRSKYNGKYNLYSRIDVIPVIEKGLSATDWSSMCSSFVGRVLWFGANLKLHQQLYNHFLLHELKTSKTREMWFQLKSSHPARFSMAEFASVTGLKCVSDHSVDVPEIDVKSVIGVDNIMYDDLVDLFCKTPKNSPKKLILAYVLVIDGILLPHRCGFVKNEIVCLATDISRLSEYPWGRLVYVETITSLMKVNRASDRKLAKLVKESKKRSYEKLSKKSLQKGLEEKVPKARSGFNLLGFPLALEIWMLEAFPKLAPIVYCTSIAGDNDHPFTKWASIKSKCPVTARHIQTELTKTAMDTMYPTYGEYLDSPLMAFQNEPEDSNVAGYLLWLKHKAPSRELTPVDGPTPMLSSPILPSVGLLDQVVPSSSTKLVVFSPSSIAARTRSKVASPALPLALVDSPSKRKRGVSPSSVSDKLRKKPATDARSVARVTDPVKPSPQLCPPKLSCLSGKFSLAHARDKPRSEGGVPPEPVPADDTRCGVHSEAVPAGDTGHSSRKAAGGLKGDGVEAVSEPDPFGDNERLTPTDTACLTRIRQHLALIAQSVLRCEARVMKMTPVLRSLSSMSVPLQSNYESITLKVDSLPPKVDSIRSDFESLKDVVTSLLLMHDAMNSNYEALKSSVDSLHMKLDSLHPTTDAIPVNPDAIRDTCVPTPAPTPKKSPCSLPSDKQLSEPTPKNLHSPSVQKPIVVAPRKSTRVAKAAPALETPYTKGLKKKPTLPRRPKYSHFELDDRKQFYDWLYSDDEHNSQIVGNEGLLDKKFFSDLVGKCHWLRDEHIGEALSHFRKYIADNSEKFSDIVILDWVFAGKFTESYLTKFQLGKVAFGKGFMNYFDGLVPKFYGKSWVGAKKVYMPFNIRNMHWVALEVDLVEKRVNVWDSNINLTTNEQMQLLLDPFCFMLPVLLKDSGRFSHLGQLTDLEFTVERSRDVPQNSDGGSCGVYTIKAIEELAFGGDIYAFDDNHVQAYREKMAIELFRKCFTVKTVV